MDSRIRELEQWLAEAKRDLGECGQEAYLQKLYLLDAEIRAVIKANGAQPTALSPGQQGRLVRGQARHSRGTKVSSRSAVTLGVAGVALLAATTVVFGLPALRGGSSLLARRIDFSRTQLYADSGQFATDVRLSGAGQSSTTPPAGFIPASLPGEEVLPVGWSPGSDVLMSETLLADSGVLASETDILAGTAAGAGTAPARMGELRPNQSGLGNEFASHSDLSRAALHHSRTGQLDVSAIMAMQPAVQPRGGGIDYSSRPQRHNGFDANQAIDVMVANGSSRESSGRHTSGSANPMAANSQVQPRGEMLALHGEVPISSGGGLGERSIGRWNFGGNFDFPADYKSSLDSEVKKKQSSRNNKKSNKQRSQAAGGAKPSEPARETRPGEAEEIRVTSSDSESSQRNEHGGEGAES